MQPADPRPAVGAQPTQDQIDTDRRTHPQRQHDALEALVRGQLGDPALGSHRGPPVTVIISASLQDLQAKTGVGITAAGTVVPMSEVIRLAGHAYHYLSVFDETTGRRLWLGRSKRIASADQRVVLHERDRGCTFRAAPCPATAARSTTPPPTGPRAEPPTSTTSTWPADPTTAWSNAAAGPPENAATAPPNGYPTRQTPPRRHQHLPPPRKGSPTAPEAPGLRTRVLSPLRPMRRQPCPAKARMTASAIRACFFDDEYHISSDLLVGIRGAVIAC